MNKIWKLYETDLNSVEELIKTFNIDSLIATILVNRQITQKDEIETFLNPTRDSFYNPFLLQDMSKAVERIIKAKNNKEKILIYGDYDVDGITSITVLKKFLDENGLETSYYIPKRLEEGYGLNRAAIDKINKQGYKLMITVDCGISAIDEIDYAKTLGIDVIVTDHHEPLNKLPNALAIIDPKRELSKYPFRELAGVGVVFKLIQAICEKQSLNQNEYLKYLDLVCIGTISDIVPLIDENRVIAKLGLKLLQVTKNIGLRSIINVSGHKLLDSNTISFGIGPRINACGRLGHQQEALNLFLTDNLELARQISEKLDKYNRERQALEKTIYQDAIKQINEEKIQDLNSIVLCNDKWHHGVIGIVSSKITELYYKPTILICFEQDIGKGSGRSIQGFDLHNALCKCSNYLEKYGGHEMAVGLSIKKENYSHFKKEFERILDNSNIKELQQVIYIDKEINLKEINLDIVKSLKILEPFGEANRIPIFLIKNLKINSIRALSEGKHLKLTLKQGNIIINCIGFNMGESSNEYSIDTQIDVVANLEINTYNGTESIQLNLKDIRKSL